MFPRSQPFALSSSGDTHAGDFEDISTRTLQSVRIGQSAGKLSSGFGNAFVGFEAGKTNVQGSFNALVGYQAGAQNAIASYATMVGAFAGAQNQRGSEVTFVGYKAGELSKDGSQLVGLGAFALRENVSGNGTVAIGYRSAERTLDGYYNTMIGTESGQDNRSGNFNTMAGYRSGRSSFLGNENTYLGAFSGYSNRRGSGNSFVGFRAGEELQDGDFNVAIGAYSMQYASKGSCNIAIGPFAGAQVTNGGSENVLIGNQVTSSGSPNRSVVLGASAGATMSGDGSVLIGYKVGEGLEVGNCNILIGTGATSFTPSNNFGIAIGSFQTLTYTNSVSIGNDIINQREYSILVGHGVSSDADNSIILGKENSIESFVVWKDPISLLLRNTVLADGQTKIGLCNIDYSDTVVSPCNEIYELATAKIFTSNVVSSLTNPPRGRVGPFSYDLREYVPEHIIHSGLMIPVRDSNEYALSNDMLFAVSNAVLSTSKPFLTNPAFIRLQDIQHNTTSNTTITLQNHAQANIAVNVRSLSNLASTIHIDCAFHHVSPLVDTTPPSAVVFPASPLSKIGSNLSLSNLVLEVSCNLDDGVYLQTTSNELRYIVEIPPQYGLLNHAIFSSLEEVTYTPFDECSMALSDEFVVRPHYFLKDGPYEYGVASADTGTLTVQFSPTTPELIAANYAVLSNQKFVLDSNVLRGIPQIPSDENITVKSIPSNFVVYSPYQATPFSSNDIERMSLCNIYDYPPEAYGSYIHTIEQQFSNVNRLCESYADNASLKLQDVVYYSTVLSDLVSTQDETIAVTNISSIAQDILDTRYPPTPFTSNATIFLSSKVEEWGTIYDPDDMLYSPWSMLLHESNQAWYDGYLSSGLYDAWQGTQLASNQYALNLGNAATLSNIVITFHTDVATSISFDSQIAAEATSIYPDFDVIFNAYFVEPRLFLTYQDVVDGGIVFASNIQEPPYQAQELKLLVGYCNLTIPIQSEGPPSTNWTDFPWTHDTGLRFTYPYASNLKEVPLDDIEQAYGYSKRYIIQPPQHGRMQGTTYIPKNPWSSNDNFTLIAENTDGETINVPVQVSYEPGHRFLPLTLVDPPGETVSDLNVTYREYNVQVEQFFVSNVVVRNRTENGIVLPSETNVEHISQYDPNVGYYFTTCNETLYRDIYPLPTFGDITYTCNLFYQSYAYDTLSHTWTEYLPSSSTIQEVFPQTGLVFASNIYYVYSNISVTSNYYAYNSNLLVIDRDDTKIQYVDRVQSAHLFSTSQQDILRPSGAVERYWSSNLATTSTLSVTTTYTSAQSNFTCNEPYFPLTRHHMSFYESPSITLSPTNPYDVVLSNVGNVTSVRFTDIESGRVWIKGKQSGNLTTSLGSIPITVISCNIDAIQDITPQTVSIPLDTFSTPLTPILNVCAAEFGAFSPTTIHVYNVKYGYIALDGSNLTTTVPWDHRQRLTYVPYFNVPNDTLQLFFSTSTDVTKVFNIPVVVNFTPSTQGQTINMGINTDSIRNSLSPYNFFYTFNNLSANIQVETTLQPQDPDIRILRKTGSLFSVVSTFSMQEVMDVRIFIEFLSGVQNKTIDFNVKNAFGTTLLPNQSFTFYRIAHVSHVPSTINQFNPTLDVTSIGQDVTYLNTLFSSMRSWYSSLILPYTPIEVNGSLVQQDDIQSEDIQVHVHGRPKLGILVHIDRPTQIVATCTLEDILQNKLRYVSYDPDNVREDLVGIRIALPNSTTSPTYNILVRHLYSHFYPYAINVALRDDVLRTVDLPPTSVTMQTYGRPWETTCNMVLPFQNNTTYTTTSCNIAWTFPSIASNVPWTIHTYASHNQLTLPSLGSTTIDVDQADSVNLDTLSNVVPNNHDFSVNVYVVSPPTYGVIQNAITGVVANKFSSSDLINGHIIYQHIGVDEPLTDTFSLTVGSSPYTLAQTELQVLVNVHTVPYVSVNTTKYVYYNDVTESNTVNPFTQNTLAFARTGYVHLLSPSSYFDLTNLQGVSETSFPSLQSNEYGFRVKSGAFSQYPYPPSEFNFTMNSHPEFHINPLHVLEPYRDMFKHTFTSYTNQHMDSNEILAQVNSNQVIAYDIDNNATLQSSIADKHAMLTIELYPEPSYTHPQFDLFLTDNFTFTLYKGDDHLLQFTVSGRTWTLESSLSATINTGQVPSSLARKAWNTLKFVNFDPQNTNHFSIYWKYQSGDEVNLLQDISVAPVPLEECTRYELRVNVESPFMYIASSNYTKQLGNGLRTDFNLHNSFLSYRIRNFQINISTYTVDDSLEYNPDSHNIIVGKDINVQGIDNICVGNKFVTSGNQSIIVGNNIGGSSIPGLGLAFINDIFQSIIVGNQSFRNSIVRDIICIGNNNFNDLSEQDTQKTRFFFAQKPIVIGNNVDASKIDYNVNLGNVFLSTSVNSKQIYLGHEGQCVGIGYTSNHALSPTRNKLYVSGAIHADAVHSSQYTSTMICAHVVESYFVMEYQDDGDVAELITTQQSPLVCGIAKASYVRTDGLYDVVVTTRGKTNVWCKSSVQPGELLVSDDFGCVVSRGIDTSMHSFTFAKSLSAWDSIDPSATPLIRTSNIAGYGTVGLISCIVLI